MLPEILPCEMHAGSVSGTPVSPTVHAGRERRLRAPTLQSHPFEGRVKQGVTWLLQSKKKKNCLQCTPIRECPLIVNDSNYHHIWVPTVCQDHARAFTYIICWFVTIVPHTKKALLILLQSETEVQGAQRSYLIT